MLYSWSLNSLVSIGLMRAVPDVDDVITVVEADAVEDCWLPEMDGDTGFN